MSNTALTLVLALLTMIGPLGIDTYLPSFPALVAEFGVTPLVIQQTLSVYMFGLAVMTLFYGTLSDSFGRRRVMLTSLGLFAIASLACAFAPSAQALIGLRLLQGLAAAAGMVIARAMVQDRFQGAEAQRTMALMTMVFGLAPAIAPLIGGWLQAAHGWRSVFVFLALFSGGLLVAGWKGLPETLPVAKRSRFHLGEIAGNYVRVLRHRRFMAKSLAIALVFCGLPLYVGSASAFVMGILHQPETAFGWLFFPIVGGLMSGSALASKLARRVSTHRMIRDGFLLMALAVGLSVAGNALWQPRLPWVMLPLTLYTFGLAIATPGMTIRTLDLFPQLIGMAASMQGFMLMLLFSIVTGFVAPLLFDSAFKLALGHAVGTGLGIGLWLLAARPKAPAALTEPNTAVTPATIAP